MEVLLEVALENFIFFLVILVRITGLFVAAPVFGRNNIPMRLKVGFSFFLALIFTNIVDRSEVFVNSSVFEFFLILIKEFLIGIIIGYVSFLFFTSIYLTGQIIDMQIGFSMANIYDPASNIQIPLTANFYFIMSTVVFLIIRGHHLLIQGIFESYKSIPIGRAIIDSSLTEIFVEIFGSIFVTGFKIAAPVTVSILIVDLFLGILSKTVPQLNVFIVGMPLKIFLGLALVMITIPAFILLLDGLFNDMWSIVLRFIREMGNG
ncbi:MAG TPA: flagellar type III secretion system protein FliR [Clostridiaceae bacterium]|nr:flagellar type III secretion system protein FliR [Clostridiaceae bacterium]